MEYIVSINGVEEHRTHDPEEAKQIAINLASEYPDDFVAVCRAEEVGGPGIETIITY